MGCQIILRLGFVPFPTPVEFVSLISGCAKIKRCQKWDFWSCGQV